MPSPWHDAAGELFADNPQLAVEILRDLMGLDIAPGLPARLGPTVFNTRPSHDLIADKVVIAGSTWDPAHVIVVENQQERIEGKRRKFPKYAASAWLQYDCPADVLVLCPDTETAAWYADPVHTGMGGSLFQPRVLFPERVPAIIDSAQVAKDPSMAVLSVAYHGADEAVADSFITGVGALGDIRTPQYYEYGFSMSAEGVREILRRLMASTHWPVYSPFAKEHYGKGEEAGRVEEGRTNVLMVLEERGLELTNSQWKRITDCTDLEQLRTWSKAAITANSADDLFA
ncbi:MAG: hypothetical protein ACRDN0_14745 [Trebonia sp.]